MTHATNSTPIKHYVLNPLTNGSAWLWKNKFTLITDIALLALAKRTWSHGQTWKALSYVGALATKEIFFRQSSTKTVDLENLSIQDLKSVILRSDYPLKTRLAAMQRILDQATLSPNASYEVLRALSEISICELPEPKIERLAIQGILNLSTKDPLAASCMKELIWLVSFRKLHFCNRELKKIAFQRVLELSERNDSIKTFLYYAKDFINKETGFSFSSSTQDQIVQKISELSFIPTYTVDCMHCLQQILKNTYDPLLKNKIAQTLVYLIQKHIDQRTPENLWAIIESSTISPNIRYDGLMLLFNFTTTHATTLSSQKRQEIYKNLEKLEHQENLPEKMLISISSYLTQEVLSR